MFPDQPPAAPGKDGAEKQILLISLIIRSAGKKVGCGDLVKTRIEPMT